MPKTIITVIMSVYNGQRFLREAVESILNQTFSDFEFIITDDGSKDNTPDILDEYERQDSRVIVIRQENAGLIESLNRMIKIAKGTFIARMDADDISLPERFEKQISKLQANPDYLAVGCWVQELDENGTISYEITFPDKPELLKKYLHKGINCYVHGSVMIRREVFEKLGLLYRIEKGEDLDLWARICEQGCIGIVEKVLYQRRDHGQTISKASIPQNTALKNLIMTLAMERKKYGKEISDWRQEEDKIFRKVLIWTEKEIQAHERFLEARKFLCSGENTKARQLLSSIKKDLNNFGNLPVLYYISCLPGFLTAPVFRLRDKINDKRYFVRTTKTS